MNDIKYVELHGEKVAYREAGAGDHVVVLLHGMAGSSETWEAILPELGTRHRVIAPDLLGHGDSDKPRGDYSLGAFAAGLRDLLDELEITRVTVIGHSLGGGVAMQFLYQHPEYCQRLILISSGGLGPDVGWILRLLSAPGAELLLPVIAPKVVLALGNRLRSWFTAAGWGSPKADQTWRAYSSLSEPPARSAFLHTLRSVVDYRGQAVSALSRLRLRPEVPTLVIWGDRDAIIPVDHGRGVSVARPGSRLEVFPGLGHFPHVESPTEVAAAITDFIAHGPEHDVAQRNSEIQTALGDALEHRTQAQVAIGVLMGLRGCSYEDAASEFTGAVCETGVPSSELGRGLIELASGRHDSTQHSVALDRWHHLLALRGLEVDDSDGLMSVPLRAVYGAQNESTVC